MCPANFGAALAIEVRRRGVPPESRDFLRFKFRNGFADPDWHTLRAFGHARDLPLTEFGYCLEVTYNFSCAPITEGLWTGFCDYK
jgi:hypothetical protein